jgi:ADP-ribose pyrophosphatase YjhB (NUDIX family)
MSAVDQLVGTLPVHTDEVAEWPPLRFRVRSYLTTLVPPLDLISSVRALVHKHSNFLVVRDPISIHILPGGRREAGETLLQTLQREVLEETGWSIRDCQLLGFAHFQHLTPKPAAYQYPYPDFLHLVYLASADRYQPELREVDGYELDACFLPLEQIVTLPISQAEQVFLTTATTAMAQNTKNEAR